MTHPMAPRSAATISFVVVVLSAVLSLADEAEMQIIIDQCAVLFSGISEPAVKELSKELAEPNDFVNPRDWPQLRTTGHPAYTLPPGIAKRAKVHPEWQLNRLPEYRVAFRDFGGDRVVLLYWQKAGTLIVLYHKLPEEADWEDTEQ